jgi:hypothetical protein
MRVHLRSIQASWSTVSWRMFARGRCLCGALLVVSTGCTARNEYREANYRNMIEARQAAGDWVPTCIPASATGLREAHYIDAGFTWLAYSCTADGCTPGERLESVPSTIRVDVPSAVTWWAPDLGGNLDTQLLEQRGWVVGTCPSENRDGYSGVLFYRPDGNGYFARIAR